jgi:protease IV
MSFKTASAILRGRWLVDKQWANAHMPIIFSVMKGDAKAGAILGLSDDDDMDEDEEDNIPKNIGKNVYTVSPGTNLRDLPDGTIAFIDIDGPLLKGGDWCSYGMEDYAEMMYGIMNADNICGVILDIDSPGGQADGTATFADAINECKQAKPVIGFIDDGLAASAAYWVISACTEVYCSQPTDAAGSIGVYCTVADWNAYYESQGLPVHDVYSTLSDDKNLDYRESIKGNDKLLQAELDVIANAFINAVKTNRKGKVNGSDWATGKMYYAADAIKQGLIDGVKSFNQIILRLNRLVSINKNSNSNTMAFEKTLVAAGAQQFEVTDAGFVLQEEQLNAIEANIAAKETAVATANTQVTEANDKVTGLTAQVEAAEQKATKAGEQLAEATTKLDAANTRIAELEALGVKPTATVAEADKFASDKKSANEFDFQKELMNQV